VNSGRNAPRFPTQTAPDPEHPLEWLAIWVGALALAVGALLWAAGELSGRVTGGSWPLVGSGQMGEVLAQFPSHARDPRDAWPTDAQALLPGPAGFYATLALLAVPVATVAILLARRRSTRRPMSETSARWASPRDLRPLRVRRARPGRLTLGIADHHLLAAEPRQSVIVIGPTQTGKTTGFAIPAILEWQGPVVATSVKTDLLLDTYQARAAIPGADVLVYDPTRSTGMPTAGWTPLMECLTWEGAQRCAHWLITAGRPLNAGIEAADFWYQSAAKLLAPVLFASASVGGSMSEVVRWIDAQDKSTILAALDVTGEPDAVAAFQGAVNKDDRTLSGIYATAQTLLLAYDDPNVLGSALTAELQGKTLLDGRANTAYVCAPAHEQRRLQPLFATLVQEIIARAYEKSTETGKPLDPPLLLVLDECANIAPLRDLGQLASTGAGQGIQLVSVFQDMAQINNVYGRSGAPTIVSNHRAKVVLSGVADPDTLDYVRRLVGDEETRQLSSTRGDEGRGSTTESILYRSLTPANALREMKPGSGLLVYGRLPPARLRLRPWYEQRRLRRRAHKPARTQAEAALTS
jgi:type IV secretion system protein VirD4